MAAFQWKDAPPNARSASKGLAASGAEPLLSLPDAPKVLDFPRNPCKATA